MHEIRTTITEGGRIVIPASIRKEMDLRIGEEVILKIEPGGLYISSLKQVVKHAQSLVKQYNKRHVSLSKALLDSRKEDSKHEK